VVSTELAHPLGVYGRLAGELFERVGPLGELLELARELLQVARLGRRG